MSWLTDPFAFEFMRQAFLITGLIAAPAGALSCLLVLKGWALMGDAISHAVLPGVVLAYILGAPLILGAFLAGLFCAGATGFLTENSRVKPDTVMGVVFSGMFGAGIVMYTAVNPGVHLEHLLFGDMLGVSWADIAETAAITALVLTVLLVRRRDLLLYAFDAQHARAIGLPVTWLHYGLLAIISLVVVGALKAVGLILAIALLIGPGAIAHLLTDRFDRMLAISMAVSVLASVTGIMLSFHVDAAPAPSIVVMLTGFFMAAFLFAPKHGILRRRAT
ncbi:MAG: metal ABC transporter permease [Pseudomonadota bacterium]